MAAETPFPIGRSLGIKGTCKGLESCMGISDKTMGRSWQQLRFFMLEIIADKLYTISQEEYL